MPAELAMPRLSDEMEEGTILKWLVDEGGQVKKGEPLVEIETDKANTTYDAEADGTLVEVLAKEGDTLAVGQPIARLEDADGGEADAGRDGDADADASDDADAGDDADADSDSAAAEGEPPEQERGTVSPIAERMAEDEGVEIA